jgi:hypothetical protein
MQFILNIFRRLSGISPWVAGAIGFAVLCSSISGQSLDVDEAQTWDCLRAGSVSDFFGHLGELPRSESQMPMGIFLWWIWSKIFGTGEMALRLFNIPWAAMGILAFVSLGRRLGLGWLPFLFVLQPMVWVAMDSATTAMIQIAGGALLAAGTVSAMGRRKLSGAPLASLCAGAIVVCGANLLGVLILVPVFLGLYLHRKFGGIGVTRHVSRAVAITALVIAGFMLVAISLKFLPGYVGIWGVSPANAIFVVYEFLGFQGLGPGRQDLRAIVLGVLSLQEIIPYLPALFALAAGYLLVMATSYKGWLTRPFERMKGSPSYLLVWCAGMGVFIQSLVLLYVVALVFQFSFWGRHLAAALPFWIVALAVTLRWASQGLWRQAGRAGVLLTLAMLALSCGQIRMTDRHTHDDYRSAAREARAFLATGDLVWWVADRAAGEYYGLEFASDSSDGPASLQLVLNEAIARDETPDAVVLSRPENFDRHHVVRTMVQSGAYALEHQFRAFEIWVKK